MFIIARNNQLNGQGQPRTDENFKNYVLTTIQEKFNTTVDLPMVFVDSYYRNYDPLESGNFTFHTQRLFDFAVNATPYECKDVKAVKLELKETIDELKEEREKTERQQVMINHLRFTEEKCRNESARLTRQLNETVAKWHAVKDNNSYLEHRLGFQKNENIKLSNQIVLLTDEKNGLSSRVTQLTTELNTCNANLVRCGLRTVAPVTCRNDQTSQNGCTGDITTNTPPWIYIGIASGIGLLVGIGIGYCMRKATSERNEKEEDIDIENTADEEVSDDESSQDKDIEKDEEKEDKDIEKDEENQDKDIENNVENQEGT